MRLWLERAVGIVLLVGIAVGLFVAVSLPFEIAKKRAAEHWPSRKGVVTTSYASYHRGHSGTRSTSYWRPEICGTYVDDGTRFCVTRIRYGGFRWGEGKGAAFAAVEKYRTGRVVDVYASPDDPKETVLEPHSSWTEMTVLGGIGLGFLVLPVLLWLGAAMRKRAP